MKNLGFIKQRISSQFQFLKAAGLKLILSRELFVRIILSVAFALVTFVATNEFASGLNGDAMFFLPQVVKYANGHGLVNPQYELTLSYSDAQDGRHIWHGFAYQLFLGNLFVPTTYQLLSIAMAVTNALAAFVTVMALGDACQRLQNKSLRTFILLLAGSTSVGFIIGLQGRPEIFFYLIVPLGYLLARNSSFWIQAIGGSAMVAIAVMTSPLSGFMLGLALAILWSSRYTKATTFISQISIGVLVMAAVIAGLFSLYPYTPNEWFQGILSHRGPIKDFALIRQWRSYLIFSGRFFFGPIVLLGVISAFVLIWHNHGRRALKIASSGISIILLFLSFYLSIYSGWYVLASLAPVSVLCTLYLLGRIGNHSSRLKVAFLSCCVFVYAISALDPALKIVNEFTGCRGLSLSTAKNQLARVIGVSFSDVAFSKSLFVLSEQTTNVDILPHEEFNMGDEILSQRRWAVIQQVDTSFQAPPSYRNYRLVFNAFHPCRPAPGRLAQWFGPKGMGFAIYERIPGPLLQPLSSGF